MSCRHFGGGDRGQGNQASCATRCKHLPEPLTCRCTCQRCWRSPLTCIHVAAATNTPPLTLPPPPAATWMAVGSPSAVHLRRCGSTCGAWGPSFEQPLGSCGYLSAHACCAPSGRRSRGGMHALAEHIVPCPRGAHITIQSMPSNSFHSSTSVRLGATPGLSPPVGYTLAAKRSTKLGHRAGGAVTRECVHNTAFDLLNWGTHHRIRQARQACRWMPCSATAW